MASAPKTFGRQKSNSFVCRRKSALRLYSSVNYQSYDKAKRLAYVENISGDFSKQTHAWNKFLSAHPYIKAALEQEGDGEASSTAGGWSVRDAVSALQHALKKWKYVYEVKTVDAARKDYEAKMAIRCLNVVRQGYICKTLFGHLIPV